MCFVCDMKDRTKVVASCLDILSTRDLDESLEVLTTSLKIHLISLGDPALVDLLDQDNLELDELPGDNVTQALKSLIELLLLAEFFRTTGREFHDRAGEILEKIKEEGIDERAGPDLRVWEEFFNRTHPEGETDE